MCFIKNIDFNKFSVYPITEVLNEDIIVVKILYKRPINIFFFKKYNYYSPCQKYKYYSPYEGYMYIKGELNISPLGIHINRVSDDWSINIMINEGFHSFCSEKDAQNSYLIKNFEAVLCKCIIPKDSTISSNGSEIVSNQIIFIEELK